MNPEASLNGENSALQIPWVRLANLAGEEIQLIREGPPVMLHF